MAKHHLSHGPVALPVASHEELASRHPGGAGSNAASGGGGLSPSGGKCCGEHGYIGLEKHSDRGGGAYKRGLERAEGSQATREVNCVVLR